MAQTHPRHELGMGRATRRGFVTDALALAGAALGSTVMGVAGASAATWPTRPVHLMAPGAPGGIFDTVARQLAGKLAPALGQPVVVENRATAGGLLAMQQLARSQPDGYTLSLCSSTQLTVNPWMFEKPAYDPIADFAPITVLFESPMVLVARPDSPYGTLQSLLDAARARPGRLSYGSSGVGHPPHVLMELVEYRGRMHLLHVAYRGGPAALAGLMAGDVDMALEGSLGTLPLIRAGRLRAIAVSGARRLDALPDVPTFAEAGIRGIENAWMGVIAPARTPPAIVERLHAEIVRALDAPDVRASYEASARLRIGNSPGEFAALIAHSTPAWRELVRVAGLKPE